LLRILDFFYKNIGLLKIKWALTVLTGFFVLLFEFFRHKFMHDMYMDWGNLLVAIFSSLLFLAYFTFIFRLIEKLTIKLNEEMSHLAVHEERDRIARSLHDNIAQTIFFMNIKALEIEKSLTEKSIAFSKLQELREAILIIDSEIRDNIFILKDDHEHDEYNLYKHITDVTHMLTYDSSIDVVTNIDNSIENSLSTTAKRKITGILQELFINIKKHAQAKKVRLDLSVDEKQIVLRVEDNGRGFSSECLDKQGTFGLRNIMNDIKAIGGNIVFTGEHGASITIEMPKDF
jgi:two-component system nitrate/nitrite sensor histidine kinase NarX/two-component system nitrate/nitrite sensor histidine kinase NarQ